MVVSMKRWKGKVAVVTGASAGIGAAIAQALVNAGLKLARRKEKVEALAKTLEDARGNLYAVQTDISNEKDVVRAFEWIEKNVGAVSILSVSSGATETEIIQATGMAIPKEIDDYIKANSNVLKAEDIADAVLYVLATPSHVQVHELLIKPIGEIF
ncbi:hypothetical protein ILUMI_11147 [Ignelater luminosus]|uniref:Farnesol dehydrogenase-like n=1 Tax=Ignelater luminosus TaxID=2038154 RepID=A0A8K0CWL4_IGNLU|nr:hypothetical protein ILUMI_11147 [Ignelater luminosus]